MLKAIRMGEFKLGLYVLGWMGILTWIAGIIANVDNFKSTILFISGLIYAFYKIWNIHLDTMKKREDMKEAKDLKKMNKKLNDAEKDK